jgi:hypothetical protein
MEAIQTALNVGPGDVSRLVSNHLTKGPLAQSLDELRSAFKRDEYVELRRFMPPSLFDAVKRDVDYLLDTRGKRRDLLIPSTGNTPRKYTNVGRNDVKDCSLYIPQIYHSEALRKFLSAIVDEPLWSVPFLPEEYLISRLHRKGDEHGWHWDDYGYALVWAFRMPPDEGGGSLEYVRGTKWNKDDPRIEEHLNGAVPEVRHPGVNCAYLLRTDTSMHRVAPLRADYERVIVCYSFATDGDLKNPISHETMELMYPETCAKLES